MDNRYQKFLAVAEMGSLSEAARLLHVTQPAITLAIASLERTLDTKLYVRKKYAVALTTDGITVAATAKTISNEIDKLRDKLGLLPAVSRTKVGIIDSLAHLLYTSVDDQKLLNDMSVMVDNSRQIIGSLTARQIDVGLITGQADGLSANIIVRELAGEEFVFVSAPNHTVARGRQAIDDWLAFNQDSTSFIYFVDQFKVAGLRVNPIFYSTSMELLKDMAIAGKGVALLPRHLIKNTLANGSLRIIETPPLRRPIWAIRRQGSAAMMMDRLSGRLNNLLATSLGL